MSVALRPVVDELSDDEGISMQTAAALLGCSVTTVRREIAAGQLDAWRVGVGEISATIRVRLGSVRRYKLDRVVVPIDRREAKRAPPTRVKSASQREALRFIDRLAKRRR